MLREKKWVKLSLLLAAVLFFCAGLSYADQRHGDDFRKGKENAILAGGGIGGSDVEIFTEIAKRAGGENGNICIVVASSYPWIWDYEDCLADGLSEEEAETCADEIGIAYGNSKMNIQYYGDIIAANGIGQYTGIYVDPTIREENSNPLLVEVANNCTGFFFTGGDQSRGIYALRDDRGKASPVLKAIQRKIRKGALMAGTSAGTAIQTRKYVIANGFNPVALTNGAAPAVWDIDESDLVYEGGVCDSSCDELLYNRFRGVGNFKYGITDTHFSDRERALRLLRLLADTGKNFGFGVDTGTSLNVKNGMMTVMGLDGVTILDLRRARVDRKTDSFNIENVRISYIREGDTYNGRRKYFRLGGEPIIEVETGELVNNDIMDEADAGGFQMVSLLADLAQSTQEIATGYSQSANPGYRVTLQKDRRTRAAIQNGSVSIVNVKMTVETLE